MTHASHYFAVAAAVSGREGVYRSEIENLERVIQEEARAGQFVLRWSAFGDSPHPAPWPTRPAIQSLIAAGFYVDETPYIIRDGPNKGSWATLTVRWG